MVQANDDQLCPDCRERQQHPDDRHASGCRYDVGLVPIGAPYRVSAPDGATLHGIGRHLHPAYAVIYHDAYNGWRTFSSHTTFQAAQKAIDNMPTRDPTPVIAKTNQHD